MEILFLGLGGFLLSYNIVYWIFWVVRWGCEWFSGVWFGLAMGGGGMQA